MGKILQNFGEELFLHFMTPLTGNFSVGDRSRFNKSDIKAGLSVQLALALAVLLLTSLTSCLRCSFLTVAL